MCQAAIYLPILTELPVIINIYTPTSTHTYIHTYMCQAAIYLPILTELPVIIDIYTPTSTLTYIHTFICQVAIYLPMVIELPVAMLACARIGAVHSVVFGGFSAESLASRLEDCKVCVDTLCIHVHVYIQVIICVCV